MLLAYPPNWGQNIKMNEIKKIKDVNCKHIIVNVIDLSTKNYYGGEKKLFVAKCCNKECRKLGKYTNTFDGAVWALLADKNGN